ncbi:MAG: DNA polymerase III subunit delta [Firmicutes bacterium]|nr:DNA polymerase III subunit delta [Bacillota bacterium]
MERLAALERRLAQGEVAPAYLFYGAEEYLRERALALLREKLVPPQALAWNYRVLFGDEADRETIVHWAVAPPVGAPRRLVVVRQAVFFGTRSQMRVLQEYLARPVHTTCLAFDTATADPEGPLFKAVRAAGEVLEFAPVRKPALSRWVARAAREAGRQITAEALRELVNGHERLTDLAATWAKLVDFVGPDRPITAADVREMAVPRVEDRIFAVLDAVGERKYARALTGLRSLVAGGENPQAVLGMLARHFRLLVLAKEFLLGGRGNENPAASLGVAPFVARKLLEQAANFSMPQLKGALAGLLAADVAVKTGTCDYRTALETFLAGLWTGTG